MVKYHELKELERKIHKKEPIDVNYYVKTGSNAVHQLLVENGLGFQQLKNSTAPEVIAVLIKQGELQDNWETLKAHQDARVRAALATKGLWPEYYIKDKKSDVRTEVVKQYPEYILELLKRRSSEDMHTIAKVLDTTNPDEVQLEKYIETHEKITKQNAYAFLPESLGYKIKLKAMKAIVSGVNATMTPIQLLQIGDVNWAKGLSPKNITEIAEDYSRSLKIGKEKEFFELYKDVLLNNSEAPASYKVGAVMGWEFYDIDVDYTMWLN